MNKARFIWLIIETEAPTLTYYYENPDTKEWGFGFNIADGGGFLPEKDIVAGTILKDAIVGVEL